MIKKILTIFICLQIASLSGYATPLIVDEFAEETLEPAPLEQYDNSKQKVKDEFVEHYVTKDKKVIPLGVRKDNVIDEVALKLDKKKIKPAKVKTKYNYAITPIPVQLRVTKNLTTRHDEVKEGDLILFKTIKTITLGKYQLPKDSEVIGRVETVSPNDLLGTPADLVVDNFVVKNNEKINFYGRVKKRGANRSWWLYPLYQAGNIAFWAAGYPLVLVRGGHAKLSTKEIYTVYYEMQ